MAQDDDMRNELAGMQLRANQITDEVHVVIGPDPLYAGIISFFYCSI